MVVVDTNVLAYLVIEGDQTEAAEALLKRDPEWAAPRLWRSELANVLALYARRGELTVEDVVERHAAAARLVQGREVEVDIARVLAATVEGPCSAYDAEFVVLARDLGVRFVTADQRLASAFPEVALLLGQTLG